MSTEVQQRPHLLASKKAGMKLSTLMLFLAFAVTQAKAATTYTFYQGGFPEGSFITGRLTGEDLNGDGLITWLGSEISSFTADFSGYSEIPPAHNFVVMYGLSLSLDTLDFWASAAVGSVEDIDWTPLDPAWSGHLEWEAGNGGAIYFSGRQPGGIDARSSERVQVTRVPEAGSSLGMLGIGLLALLGARRAYSPRT